jgi:hypothetical protein
VSLWAEDSFGEELVDLGHDEVFAHVDRGWVAGVFVGASAVVVLGVAAVVGDAVPWLPIMRRPRSHSTRRRNR